MTCKSAVFQLNEGEKLIGAAEIHADNEPVCRCTVFSQILTEKKCISVEKSRSAKSRQYLIF